MSRLRVLCGTPALWQLNYLLQVPGTSPAKRAEVAGQLGHVMTDLAVSLGLDRSTLTQQVSDGRGLVSYC